METQKELILKHLQEHGSITSMEAFTLFGATRLSAIIYDLRRKDGYNITSELEKVKTRQGHITHIARYSLKQRGEN